MFFCLLLSKSLQNKRIASTTSLTAGILTVTEDLLTESAENIVKINQVQYPKGIELVFANMLGFILSNKHGVKSESIARYSVSYNNDAQNLLNGYPDSVIKPLTKWRKVYNDY